MGQVATKAAGSAGRAIANNTPSSSSAAAAVHHQRHEAVELATVIAQGRIKAPTTLTTTTTIPINDAAMALSAVAARHQRHQDEIAAEMSAVASGRYDNAGGITTHNGSGSGSGSGGVAQQAVTVMHEMPPDLLKFLTDIGPLHKTLDKSATSSRIYEVLEKGGTKVRDEHAKAANSRIRRRMPLIKKSSQKQQIHQQQQQQQGGDGDDTGSHDENTIIHDGKIEDNYYDDDDDDEEEDDGTTVTRTTNFSTVDRSSSAMPHRGLSLTREDYFRILSNNNTTINNNNTNNNNLGAMSVDGPEWKAAVKLEYKKMTSSANNNIAVTATTATTTTTTIATINNDTHQQEDNNNNKDEKKSSSITFDELRDIKLFEDSLHYIGLPVLMQDNDGDIIGVWSHKVPELRHSLGLKVVSEGGIQFVMKNE